MSAGSQSKITETAMLKNMAATSRQATPFATATAPSKRSGQKRRGRNQARLYQLRA